MRKIISVLATGLLLAACNTTSEGTLRKATANTLNLGEHGLTISNKKDSATNIKYDVTTLSMYF